MVKVTQMKSNKGVIILIFVFLMSVFGVGVWRWLEISKPTIHITAEEFRFVPGKVELDAYQDVQLVVINQGREPHLFYGTFFEHQAVRVAWESGKNLLQDRAKISLLPGQSVKFIANFPPGVYPFRCRIKGHRGMEGILVVRSEGRARK